MVPKDGDLADTVRHDARRRTIEEHDVLTHLKNVFVARRNRIEDDLPETERQRVNCRIVLGQELDQFRRRIVMAASSHRIRQSFFSRILDHRSRR